MLRRDLGELYTEVAVLRGDVAGFRAREGGGGGRVGGAGGGQDGRVGGVGRGRDGRDGGSWGGGAGGGQDDREGGGRDMGAGGRDGSAGGVTEEEAEGTPEVVVEGDERAAEDKRTPEMTDDDVVFVSEGAMEVPKGKKRANDAPELMVGHLYHHHLQTTNEKRPKTLARQHIGLDRRKKKIISKTSSSLHNDTIAAIQVVVSTIASIIAMVFHV
ncbi:Hypothetical predicted protein [Olea europaea subsp. europaea]|uniref:Uncharacterized protein n=1 Tax=Olea europaea subsp. europaea TaxID=158383 RepID=A0A8S0QC93_OLEEU|nr:Hypothetical predicted protein [Olea europaea subsp. europaea]